MLDLFYHIILMAFIKHSFNFPTLMKKIFLQINTQLGCAAYLTTCVSKTRFGMKRVVLLHEIKTD